jgi:hypothetical protein
VRKKARSSKEIDVFQGKNADFSRYLGFGQAIELFPIMSKSLPHFSNPRRRDDGFYNFLENKK